MKKNAVAAAIAMFPLLNFAGAALAAPGDQAPGAGQLLRELPPQPVLPSAAPTLNIQQSSPSSKGDSQPFRVETIAIDGNTLIDGATLHALVEDAEHRQLTLGEAEQVAGRITALYQQRGYPLTRAVIPAQTLSDGKLRVQVIEAVYGKVVLHNDSLTRDSSLASTVASLESGQAVSQGPLDRALLQLSDTPGVLVSATLGPGAEVGSTDLSIATSAPDRISGSGLIDDDGNRFTGRTRLSANLAIASPFGLGDQFTANVLTSGSDLNNGAVGYSLPVIDLATRAGVDYSALDYRLGGRLSPLDAFGTATVADAWVSHSFVRSADFNSLARLEFANRQLNDSIDSTGLHTDRHTDSLTATWNVDSIDSVFGGGSNALSFGVTAGQLDFDSPGAASFDRKSAKTAGSYSKFDFSFSRLQTINSDTSLFISWVGQYSNGNLDSSEQLIAGGATAGRGYDVGAISGDEGDLLTLELRRRVPIPIAGVWQAKVFYDADYIEVNANRFAPGPNSARLNSLGVGLDWFAPAQWTAKLDLGKSVGATPTLVGSSSSGAQVWLQVSKSF